MAWAPIAMAAGGSLIQGVAAIQQGEAQAKGAKVEAQTRADELKRDAQMTQIAAEQSQAARLEQLQRTQGAITATLSARGLNLSSPSAIALNEAATNYATRDMQRERFVAGQQIGADNQAARGAISMGDFKAKVARAAGYTSAIGSLFKAASFASSGFGGGSAAASGGAGGGMFVNGMYVGG